MAFPTLIAFSSANSGISNALNEPSATLTWQTGDVLVVFAGNEGGINGATFSISNTGSGLSWSNPIAHSPLNDAGTYAWTTTATANSSGIITVTESVSNTMAMGAYQFRAPSGQTIAVGTTNLVTDKAATPFTAAITMSGADSSVCWAMFDWGANVGTNYTASPTPTTHSAASPGPTASPVAPTQEGTHYTFGFADLDDETSTGSQSFGYTGSGLTTPLVNIAVVEVKITASSASSIPTTRDRILLRGIRDATAIAHMRMRQPVIPPTQTQPIGIWLPASPFPAARARSFFVVRGRQVRAVPNQEAPIVEQRSPDVRWEPPRLFRGTRFFPVQSQVPVPKSVMGNRIDSERGKIISAQRGRQWTVVPSQAVAVVSSWIPQRTIPKRLLLSVQRGRQMLSPSQDAVIGQTYPHVRGRRRFPSVRKGRQAVVIATQAVVAAPSWVPSRANVRKAFSAAQRGKGRVVPTDQPTPVRTAPKRSQVMQGRGRVLRHISGQVHLPVRVARAVRDRIVPGRQGKQSVTIPIQVVASTPTWIPIRIASRKLLSVAQRGRRVMPTPPQVPVPSPSIPRTVGRWRWAALRKGRQTNPVLTQAATAPPTYPPSKLGAARRLLSGAARGKQVTPVLTQAPAVLKPVIANRVPALRRLVGLGRGKRYDRISGQHQPIAPGGRSPQRVSASRPMRRSVPTGHHATPLRARARTVGLRARRTFARLFPWFQAVPPSTPGIAVYPVAADAAIIPMTAATLVVNVATAADVAVVPVVGADVLAPLAYGSDRAVTPMVATDVIL